MVAFWKTIPPRGDTLYFEMNFHHMIQHGFLSLPDSEGGFGSHGNLGGKVRERTCERKGSRGIVFVPQGWEGEANDNTLTYFLEPAEESSLLI